MANPNQMPIPRYAVEKRWSNLALSAGIQNIEHRAVGGSAVRTTRDRFRKDGLKLDEVGEFFYGRSPDAHL